MSYFFALHILSPPPPQLLFLEDLRVWWDLPPCHFYQDIWQCKAIKQQHRRPGVRSAVLKMVVHEGSGCLVMVSQKFPSNTFKPESFWSKDMRGREIFILKKGMLLNSCQHVMGSFVTAIFQLFLLGIRHQCHHVFDCNLEALGSIQACQRDIFPRGTKDKEMCTTEHMWILTVLK